jgi:O2-independent ubiquinone biosynthesis accessory factor UbiT
MLKSLPALPQFMQALHRRLPWGPPSWLVAQYLNRQLGAAGLQDWPEGSVIQIEVLDWGINLALQVQPHGFVAAASHAKVDLRVAATAADFYAIARREEDPDTLFFNRRLLLEGDTELGLRAKNWLDSLELPRWLQAA